MLSVPYLLAARQVYSPLSLTIKLYTVSKVCVLLVELLYFGVSWSILSPLNLHPKVGGGFPSAAHTKV